MGLKRIIWHWTAGTHVVSALDRKHYNLVIAGDGRIVHGDHSPEANTGVLRPGAYARMMNPDAVKRFKLDDVKLRELVKGHMQVV